MDETPETVSYKTYIAVTITLLEDYLVYLLDFQDFQKLQNGE